MTEYDANLFGRELSNISSPVAHVLSLLPRRWCVVGMWDEGVCVDMSWWAPRFSFRRVACDNCGALSRFGSVLHGFRGCGASVLCRRCSH